MDVRIQAIHFDASEKLVAFKLSVVKPETAMNKEAVVKVTLPQNEQVVTKIADTFEEAIDLCLEALDKMLEKSKDKK